jgi:hypothetical protein
MHDHHGHGATEVEHLPTTRPVIPSRVHPSDEPPIQSAPLDGPNVRGEC